nr:EOG090X0464 [Ilyocryptus agilis]
MMVKKQLSCHNSLEDENVKPEEKEFNSRTPNQKMSASFFFNSCKKNSNQKENFDITKTPTDSKLKISASFLFSSCKKRQMQAESLLPGHTILVGESSDEEFVNGEDNESPREDSQVVDESLVEYSLIRRWLQNADSLSSSNEDDESKSPFVRDSDDDKEKSRQRAVVEDTIVLSSDDEGASPLLPLHGCSPKNRLAVLKLSGEGDDFDSSFTAKPLREKLLQTKKSEERLILESSSDEGEDSSLNVKSDVVLSHLGSIKKMSDDDDDSLVLFKVPSKSRPLTLESSSDEDEEVASKAVESKPRIIESDLEDVFVSLTITERPKPKKAVKSRVVKPELRIHAASFLSSLSAHVTDEVRHPEAVPYVKSFRRNRDELTRRLFALFNERVFNYGLPRDFSITWNNRLTRTAGYCRHFTRKQTDGTIIFESRIELSVKVVDTACRLRDTLIHELCHASTWMIDNCRGGHGPVWRKWANSAVKTFPELPQITRCHNYEISYKFYYNCTVCSFSTGRHSKSIDTATHVCPLCLSKLQLGSVTIGNKAPEATPSKTPKAPRTPNAFAMFVKEHYASTKSSRSDLPHAAVMKILSAKFADTKKQSV